MMSLTALSADAMLPALAYMGNDLGVHNPDDSELTVSALFVGLAIGQLFFGPLSDWTGSKPAVHAGYGLVCRRLPLAALASTLPSMLAGHVLQGLGASAPRAITLALVRGRFAGRAIRHAFPG